MRIIGLPLLVAALFSMLGGTYGTVQLVAWSTMIWKYSAEERSLLAGAEKTFSGEAPCHLCKAVKEEREKEEKKPATVKVEKKAEISERSTPMVAFAPLMEFQTISSVAAHWKTRRPAPAGPVPRA
jgi:hypothetical protein